MKDIKIGGRTIPLQYTTFELIQIQEELGCTGHQLRDEVFGIRQEDEDDPTSIVFDCVTHGDKTKKLGTLIRILGNAGLEEAGETPDLTNKKVLRALRPADLANVVSTCMDAMNEGMASEIPEKEQTGPVDVTLEEIKKNETTGS